MAAFGHSWIQVLRLPSQGLAGAGVHPHTTQPQASRVGAPFPPPSRVGCERQSEELAGPLPPVPMPCSWPGNVASDLVLHRGDGSCPLCSL